MMETYERAPNPMRSHGEMDKNWGTWKKEFNIFIKTNDLTNKSSSEKAMLLLNLIGKKGREAAEDLSFRDKRNVDILMMKLDEHFNPPKTETTARYEFFSRYKKYGESINEYILDLWQKAENCNFGRLGESLIQDVIILQTKDEILRGRLLREKDLNLARIIELYNYFEKTQKPKTEILSDTQNESVAEKLARKKCWRCNRNHPMKQCPAWNQTCFKCGMLHHYSMCCPKYRQRSGITFSKSDSTRNENLLLKDDHVLLSHSKEGLHSASIQNQCSKLDPLVNASSIVIQSRAMLDQRDTRTNPGAPSTLAREMSSSPTPHPRNPARRRFLHLPPSQIQRTNEGAHPALMKSESNIQDELNGVSRNVILRQFVPPENCRTQTEIDNLDEKLSTNRKKKDNSKCLLM